MRMENYAIKLTIHIRFSKQAYWQALDGIDETIHMVGVFPTNLFHVRLLFQRGNNNNKVKQHRGHYEFPENVEVGSV